MDPRALWLSASFAAAKIALAMWIGQLAQSSLDRRRVTLPWQIMLSAAAIVASGWAVRASGVPSWWGPAWIASSLLAATALVDSVRRWISSPDSIEQDGVATGTTRSKAGKSKAGKGFTLGQVQPARLASHRIHHWIALAGLGIAAVASAAGLLGHLPHDTLTRAAAVVQLLTAAGLLGIVMATNFELTIGATGAILLSRNWRSLARWSSLALLLQLAASAIVIAFRRDGATLAESVTPIFFALGMVVAGYIVWAIPRQMVMLAAKGRMKGQVSLALAGWLAAICLAVACALPAAWPWSQIAPGSSPDSAGAAVGKPYSFPGSAR